MVMSGDIWRRLTSPILWGVLGWASFTPVLLCYCCVEIVGVIIGVVIIIVFVVVVIIKCCNCCYYY